MKTKRLFLISTLVIAAGANVVLAAHLLDEAEEFFRKHCGREKINGIQAFVCDLRERLDALTQRVDRLARPGNPLVGTWQTVSPATVATFGQYSEFRADGSFQSFRLDADGITQCQASLHAVIDENILLAGGFFRYAQNGERLTLTAPNVPPVELAPVDMVPDTHRCKNVTVEFSNVINLPDSRRVLTFGPDGLVATGPADGRMHLVNEADGTITGEVFYTLGQFYLPIAYDGAKLWLVCECGGNNEVKDFYTGDTLDVAAIIGAPSNQFNIRSGAAEPSILYVSGFNYSLGKSQLHKIDTGTQTVMWTKTFAQRFADDLTLDPTGNFVYQLLNNVIVRIDANNGSIVDSFSFPQGGSYQTIEQTPTALWVRKFVSPSQTELQRIAFPAP